MKIWGQFIILGLKFSLTPANVEPSLASDHEMHASSECVYSLWISGNLENHSMGSWRAFPQYESADAWQGYPSWEISWNTPCTDGSYVPHCTRKRDPTTEKPHLQSWALLINTYAVITDKPLIDTSTRSWKPSCIHISSTSAQVVMYIIFTGIFGFTELQIIQLIMNILKNILISNECII